MYHGFLWKGKLTPLRMSIVWPPYWENFQKSSLLRDKHFAGPDKKKQGKEFSNLCKVLLDYNL